MPKVQEFLSRQRLRAWLETHVWHAKRMHMTTRWGFRLALHPNDKVRKATFRAVKHHCLMRDTSYIRPAWLEGPEPALRRLLHTLTSPLEPSITHPRHLEGGKQGEAMLYEFLQFPTRCIGPVTFLWCPQPAPSAADEGDTTASRLSIRKLAVWLHPALAGQVLDTMRKAIAALELQDLVSVRPPDDSYVSFTLHGPRAQAILSATLALVSEGVEGKGEQPPAHRTWQLIRTLHSPATLPPGVALALRVHDPRLAFPTTKFAVGLRAAQPLSDEMRSTQSDVLAAWPPRLTDASPLWDAAGLGAWVGDGPTIATEHQLNARRAQALLPGTPLTPLATDATVPILLCQANAGAHDVDSKHREFACGWTIHLPRGWGRAFWKAFIFAGARAGGLREEEMRCHEGGRPAYPTDYPFTAAYQEAWEMQRTEQEESHRHKQKGKRINYDALHVTSPFAPGLASLVQAIPVLDATPFVVRGARWLSLLRTLVTPVAGRASLPWTEVERHAHRHLSALVAARDLQLPWHGCLTNAFVPVRLAPERRGVVEACGLVYRPASRDELDHWRRYPRPDVSAFQQLPKDTAIMGHTTSGSFSLSAGAGASFATVRLADVHQLLAEQDGQPIVLVRDVKSRVCRVAHFEWLL